jgi:hypothetical protein
MIYKRLVARLRAQDWLAITIEIAIVIIGVFIGTQVSNWNQARLETRETQRMLTQLEPQLRSMTNYFGSARRYYATTRAYATTAIAGWRGDPGVGDGDFVIAAYQASQIYVFGANGGTWSTILGADQLRNIDDPALRADLAALMSADYSQIDLPSVDTPYRRNVRRIIPLEIQEAIRERCGDSRTQDYSLLLPARCDLHIAPPQAARAAALLRAHPELMEDLQWHTAATANFLDNIRAFEVQTRNVQAKVKRLPQ